MKKMYITGIAIMLTAFVLSGCGAKPSGMTGGTTGGTTAGTNSGSSDGTYSNSTANSDSAAPMPPAGSMAAGDQAFESAASPSAPYIPNSDEEYLEINENRMTGTQENPVLTFSLKVDTASYRNVARYIESGNLPPADAVRIEEMINYFTYEQDLEPNDTPFSVYTEIGPSPFSAERNLAFVRIKSKDIDREELPPSNLTFLIDVSGSMSSYDKLPLLKSAFGLLVETLDKDDIVSIVIYAGNSQVVLDSVRGNNQKRIMDVINALDAKGNTNGEGGIQTAYRLAEKNFIEGGNNRVILATDGDFNVGVSGVGELEQLITEKRETGVYLSILGVGTENVKDNKMETLAKNGNGNYSYLDTVATAKKVLVDELTTNLYVIANDVKAQVDFNPALVSDYRLIGYENRRMANRDFNNDAKDAGEIGIGTDVVLMFELTLAANGGSVSKYGGGEEAEEDLGAYGDEFFEVRLRYKNPGETVSQLIAVPVKTDRLLAQNTSDFNFASCVAAFGHLLRESPYRGGVTPVQITNSAEENLGRDEGKLRKEFVQLLKKYQEIR